MHCARGLRRVECQDEPNVYYRTRGRVACLMRWDSIMKRCDHCGNNYDKCFEIVHDGQEYSFDSFECAIQTLAPECGHCGCRIIGHGVEAGDVTYCCAHCARSKGEEGLVDNTAND